jgi:hypothetical protein
VNDDRLNVREGDVLVVSYPEVKIPLATKYSTITAGGLIYTRRLVPGDIAQIEYDKIYGFLKSMAERDAREKVKLWTEELAGAQRRPPPPLPPKPAGAVEPRPATPPATVQPQQTPAAGAGQRPKPTTAVQR